MITYLVGYVMWRKAVPGCHVEVRDVAAACQSVLRPRTKIFHSMYVIHQVDIHLEPRLSSAGTAVTFHNMNYLNNHK